MRLRGRPRPLPPARRRPAPPPGEPDVLLSESICLHSVGQTRYFCKQMREFCLRQFRTVFCLAWLCTGLGGGAPFCVTSWGGGGWVHSFDTGAIHPPDESRSGTLVLGESSRWRGEQRRAARNRWIGGDAEESRGNQRVGNHPPEDVQRETRAGGMPEGGAGRWCARLPVPAGRPRRRGHGRGGWRRMPARAEEAHRRRGGDGRGNSSIVAAAGSGAVLRRQGIGIASRKTEPRRIIISIRRGSFVQAWQDLPRHPQNLVNRNRLGVP